MRIKTLKAQKRPERQGFHNYIWPLFHKALIVALRADRSKMSWYAQLETMNKFFPRLAKRYQQRTGRSLNLNTYYLRYYNAMIEAEYERFQHLLPRALKMVHQWTEIKSLDNIEQSLFA